MAELQEGESIIESTIWGEPDSLLKLTFKNSRTGQVSRPCGSAHGSAQASADARVGWCRCTTAL
eukprot:3767097-Rhodomonas_salina.3